MNELYYEFGSATYDRGTLYPKSSLLELYKERLKENCQEAYTSVYAYPSSAVFEVNELHDIKEYQGIYRDWETDRKSTRLNSSHRSLSRMPSSA